MARSFQSLDTKLVHAGEPQPRIEGAVSMPIFQSATFEYAGAAGYHDLKYIRLNNTPNHAALHRKLAALENAEDALVTASGMAAISTALLTVLASGDHLLVQNTLYGGTHGLICEDLAKLGIAYDFIDAGAPDTWEGKLRHNTRAIYVETITNPLVQVGDLQAVADFARRHYLVSMIDNTFASPVNFRPAERGFDLSIHSGTKYLNGHSDLVAGALIGKGELIGRITHKLNHLGGTLDPHTCFLLQRGMKTLALRVRCQNRSALQIARFLRTHPAIQEVNYPGLEDHPSHPVARELLDGFGGMLSFDLRGGLEAAERMMKGVHIPVIAPSLGGVESLMTRPALTSHAGLTPEARQTIGIGDGLVRMSVGIEDVDELIADLKQALDKV